jgi:mono/diheme cytochrome c family protein
MPRIPKLFPLLFITAAGAAACSKDESRGPESGTHATTTTTTTTTVAVGDPAAKAKEIFSQRCSPCHGAEGRGDGAASASLNPQPRNFHDPEWQASITDDYLTKIIQYGGAAVGKNAAMPGNPDLKDPAVIAALAAYVRDLGKH